MKRHKLPLLIGIAGLLGLQVGCADAPTGPELDGALDPREMVDVYIYNAVASPVTVSLEAAGTGVARWSLEGRESQRVQVTARALRASGPLRFVATTGETAQSRASDEFFLRDGWSVEVSITDAGVTAGSLQRDGESAGGHEKLNVPH